MVNSSERLDAIFSALSDPTRRRIVERLSRGSLTVGQIAAGFSISQPAVSKHVRALEEAGILRRAVLGRVHLCSISPEAMQAASGWIERQRKFWNATLDRLEEVLENTPQRKSRKT